MATTKQVTSIELPLGKYKATKLESNHDNVPKVCRGTLWGGLDDSGYTVKVGKGFCMMGGVYEGLTTTAVKEIEVFPNYVIIKTQNSTYRIEEDTSRIYGNGDK